MRAATPVVELDSGALRFIWPTATWTDVRARCLTADGAEHEGDDWLRSAAGATFTTHCGPLEVALRCRPQDDVLELQLQVVASDLIEVNQVCLQGRAPLLEGGGPVEWVLYSAYQSWDAAGVLPAGTKTAADQPARRRSWWTIGLANAVGAGLAAAGSSGLSSGILFQHTADSFSITWCEAEGAERPPSLCRLAAGETWAGDGVRFTVDGDVRYGLARLVGQRAPAEAPQGWLSWYHYGPWVEAGDVLANARLLASPSYSQPGYRIIQVDDGWQQAYGDWTPNTKFPGGLEALAAALREQGQSLGVWTAPFLVSAGADLAVRAPADWFLSDPASGERAVDPRHVVFGPMYVLDARNPAVLEHLRRTFAGLHRAGVSYFKIDFLYAGAYAGTPALRAGVAAIREAVGDSYVLACGAPLLPMVGLVHGCRVGQDTATPIYDFEVGRPRPSLFGDAVHSVARNVAARSVLEGWFQIDADVALVGGDLSVEQGRQLVTVAALSGGPFFASDDLGALPPERLALLTNPEVLGLVGRGAALPDWQPGERDHPPDVWRLGDVVGVFNWEDDSRTLTIRLPGRGRLRDLWQRRDLGGFDSQSSLEVPANDVRLVRASSG